jgi:hypothetical protein
MRIGAGLIFEALGVTHGTAHVRIDPLDNSLPNHFLAPFQPCQLAAFFILSGGDDREFHFAQFETVYRTGGRP